MQDDITSHLRDAEKRIEDTRAALEELGRRLGYQILVEERVVKPVNPAKKFTPNNIHAALATVSKSLADSYAQVKIDVADKDRISWAGTANEIREILREILDNLAPDEKVKAQSWYQVIEKSGPTRKQKIKYIMEQYGASSTETELVEKAGHIEVRVEDVISAGYKRANAATHRSRGRTEVTRILNYFEAFAHDLLNIE